MILMEIEPSSGGYSYAFSYEEKDISIHFVTAGVSLATPEFHWHEGKGEVLWSDSWGD